MILALCRKQPAVLILACPLGVFVWGELYSLTYSSGGETSLGRSMGPAGACCCAGAAGVVAVAFYFEDESVPAVLILACPLGVSVVFFCVCWGCLLPVFFCDVGLSVGGVSCCVCGPLCHEDKKEQALSAPRSRRARIGSAPQTQLKRALASGGPDAPSKARSSRYQRHVAARPRPACEVPAGAALGGGLQLAGAQQGLRIAANGAEMLPDCAAAGSQLPAFGA